MQSRNVGLRLAVVVAAMLALLAPSTPAVAADVSLRVEPPTVTVAEGGSFTIRVIQEAPGATSGAQATITFDPDLLAVEAVARGAAYADAPIFLPADMTAAISAANSSGRLATVAAALIPPGSVPAGPAEFLVVTFRAVGCGTSELGLPVGPLDGSMIDGSEATYGGELPVVATGGTVTTCVAGGDAPADSSPPASGPGPAAADGGPPWLVIGRLGAIAVAAAAGIAWLARGRARP